MRDWRNAAKTQASFACRGSRLVELLGIGLFCFGCHSRQPELSSAGSSSQGARAAVAAKQGPAAATKFFEIRVGPARRHEGREAEHVFAVRALDESPDRGIEISAVVDVNGVLQTLPRERAWLEANDGRKTLYLEQQTKDGTIVVRIAVTPNPDRPLVDVETEVTNKGRFVIQGVRLGLMAQWPGRPTFAPGLGFVRSRGTGQAAWVGRESTGFTYAIAFPEGPEAVSFPFDHVGPVGVVAWSQARIVQPAQTVTVRRVILGARGQLSDVAADAWKLVGITTGLASGKLDPAPKWATIDALDASGQLVLRTRPSKDGAWRLPLPPGSYRLHLRSPGGMDDVPVVIIEDEETAIRLVPPRAGQFRFLAEDAAGRALPTRWTFHGVAPTRDPELGPEPNGHPNVVFSGSGDGSVELPEGTYQVIATRGPEYSVFSRDVVVRREAGAVARAKLERRVDTSGWIACDFHLHAAPSFDSEVTLEQRVMSLLAEGVEFAAATDHNIVTDYGPAVDTVAPKGALATVPGVEVTTSEWGHFNVFPYPPGEPLPPYRDTLASLIFSAARTQAPDAVIQVNHPRMGDIGYFNRGELDAEGGHTREGFSFDFDTIEVFNGFDLGKPDSVTLNLESWFHLLNAGRHFSGVGNSDSHRLSVQWAGYPRTYVRVPDDDPAAVTPSEVVRGLKEGAVVVSNGPFVRLRIDGHGPGETVSAPDKRVRADVEIQTAGWIVVDRLSVIVNGTEATSQEIAFPRNGRRVDLSIPIDTAADSWIVVIVRGDTPMDLVLPHKKALPLAFTNPIYVDTDGDGRYSALTAVPTSK